MKKQAVSIKARESHEMCYVCKRPIQKHPVYIGHELYRHIRCVPGGARWMASEIGQQSAIREYFEIEGGMKDEKQPEAATDEGEDHEA